VPCCYASHTVTSCRAWLCRRQESLFDCHPAPLPAGNATWRPPVIRFRLDSVHLRLSILSVSLATACALCFALTGTAFGQDPAVPDTPQPQIVLTKLSQPVYPPLARQTAVAGEVIVLLDIRRDGTVASAVINKGHPILQQAAIDSAMQSQFECREGSDAVTPYTLVYTFQLIKVNCCSEENSPPNHNPTEEPQPGVTRSQNHITVIDRATCFCDPGGIVHWKVRSIKCLYLWKCARGIAVAE
jgi:TonB family protein